MPQFTAWLNALLPRCCLLCRQPSTPPTDICNHCARLLPRLTAQCQRCATPITKRQRRCGQCLLSPPAFDQAWALYAYQPPITSLIKQYKFQRKYAHSGTFSTLMIQALTHQLAMGNIEQPDAIIAMPQHWTRTLHRGFNHSLELSLAIAHHFGLPCLDNIVKRQKRTAYQTRLTPSQRQHNLNNAFRCIKPINDLHIAIVDDILTTGASANALADTLKHAGASKISVWALARTTPP